MSDGTDLTWCEDHQDQLAELALGTLTGRERGAVLAHIESCPRCAHEVEEMSLAADELLHVAPAVEPPVGFETRLFERLGTRAPRRVRWSLQRRRVLVGVAALAGAIGLGFATAWSVLPSGPGTSAHVVAGAPLTSHHQDLGKVVLVASPDFVLMTLRDAHWSGRVTCEVTTSSGGIAKVGTFWLSSGYGRWSAALPVPATSVTGARVVGANGVVVASAVLKA
ncbi:MAG TPA: zf-HC2 domain-containing protein [Acidimicrobiales bacterium]|nr:zf-HC2 domain-containing protein [Acidimicrobiales bacterium]